MNFYQCLFQHRNQAKHLQVARLGENFAKSYLELHNYIILEQNWTVPFGELDIIAQDGRSLVIIEVKTRRAKHFTHGSVFDQINKTKQKKLQSLGLLYARQNRALLKIRRICHVRWEVIGVGVDHADTPASYLLRHYLAI